MTDAEFFAWFEEQNPDIPKGTEVTANYDYIANQLYVTYEVDGVKHYRVYNVNYIDGKAELEEITVPRNEFEQNVPIENEDKEVPLTLGVGGPVVGTAKVTKDGVVIGEITDDNLRKKLQGDLSSFAIGRDPADRYRVNPEG
ncbi:hypothetical protein SEA_RAVENPUFF_43 [Streptomyces phage RavenPuff]|nr:hypothetical protein SEA_RAVENPUFF_43 [Streptomyces phage RavenPuff]UVK63633.1 hypothetical protein SEA_DOXI13_44 [Streptomyces phage Doxi13]